MGRDKKNEKRVGQFAMWIFSETKIPAWKALSGNAQAAYMHFSVRCWTEGKKLRSNNNGKVGLSARMLAKEMGVNDKTAMTAMADLQAKGWIVCTMQYGNGLKGKALAPEWRLTMRPTTNRSATREPLHWNAGHDYEVKINAKSRRPGHARGDASRFGSSKLGNIISLREALK